MRVAHARALLPSEDVAVRPYEPQRDEAALHALARWARRFTPVVAADPPDGLLMDMTGCERLYGGEQAMLEHTVQHVRRLGVTVRAALAPTVGCAWAAARFGAQPLTRIGPGQVRAALAQLPVRALRISADTAEALHEVAIDRVEHLLRLPREELAARFGSELLHRLDQALGHRFEGIDTLPPEAPARVQRVFDEPVKKLEAVQQAVRELVDELTEQLANRERGAQRIVLLLDRLDAEAIEQHLTLSRPSRSAKHLWALLAPRTEALHLGWGVERLRLAAPQTIRLPHEQGACLDADERSTRSETDKAAAELVDLLTSRLGARRVLHVQPVGTHVPERAFVWQPTWCERAAHDPASWVTGVAADRPVLLHAQPHPVDVTLLAPDGPVVQMRCGSAVLAVHTSIGPERITPRWWLVSGDRHKPPPRDYFKVQDEQGRWWWVYRKTGTSQWFVHGEWA